MPMPKQADYKEGPEVTDKFEQAMKILFQTPKPEVDRKGKRTPKTSVRKTKSSDKD
jgi:hypothetical protein